MTYKVENGEDNKHGVDPDGVLQPGRLDAHDELPVKRGLYHTWDW